MIDKDAVFSGSIPETYDACMVPLIFEAYAADLARRAAAHRPARVLETAAGTGIVTRTLAPMLEATASYVATDLNPAMLERAAGRQPAGVTVEWHAADAGDLPFDSGHFDVVCCQFGAMFFPDRVAAYREALRVLKPGGRLVFNVWDRIEANGFADQVTRALEAIFPADPPRFLARTPHGYHETDRIVSDVRAAGFVALTIETIDETSRAATPRHPALGFCQGTVLRTEIEARRSGALEQVTDAVAEAIARRYGRGPVAAPMRAHVIEAVAPG